MFVFSLSNNCAIMHLLMLLSVWTLVTSLEAKLTDTSDHSEKSVALSDKIPTWDPNGYVYFCLCMGRFGNKIDHFLGGLAFAKSINRTLILPPFRTYINVPFTEWFQKEPLEKYHRVIPAEDFMKYLAPDHWPVGSRKGFCYQISDRIPQCQLKGGEPFTGFWDDQHIDFDVIVPFNLGFNDVKGWQTEYPPSNYPVIAMRGAPASYPIEKKHRYLQKYLVLNEHIEEEAQHYIDEHFKDEKFVGIHLRNGEDWVNACSHLDGSRPFMSSPQCRDDGISEKQCLPSEIEVLMKTREAVKETGAKVVFVATDKKPMLKELERFLQDLEVRAYHMDPHLPLIDIAILNKSTWFVGNCVSSFSAYVKRHRDAMNNPNSSFFGM